MTGVPTDRSRSSHVSRAQPVRVIDHQWSMIMLFHRFPSGKRMDPIRAAQRHAWIQLARVHRKCALPSLRSPHQIRVVYVVIIVIRSNNETEGFSWGGAGGKTRAVISDATSKNKKTWMPCTSTTTVLPRNVYFQGGAKLPPPWFPWSRHLHSCRQNLQPTRPVDLVVLGRASEPSPLEKFRKYTKSRKINQNYTPCVLNISQK
jgi:hypothetical protein